MSIDLSQFLAVFFEESEEGLAVVESSLLEMDTEAPDAEAINAVFRAIHSLKGGCGTFGINELTPLIHGEETLLDEVRSGQRRMTEALVDHLLRVADVLRDLLATRRRGDAMDMTEADRLEQECEVLLHGNAVVPVPVSAPDPVAAVVAKRDTGRWRLVFEPQPQILQTGNDVVRIFRELRERVTHWEVAVNATGLPEWADLDPERLYLQWRIQVDGNDLTQALLQEPFDWILDECRLEVFPETAMPAAAAEPMPATETAVVVQPSAAVATPNPSPVRVVKATETSKDRDMGTIRVGLDKIDALVNLVGELVINQSVLNQIGENFTMNRLDKLQEGLAQMAQHTRMIQENVMRIRMLPISVVFSRFPRLVRDTALQLGKQVQLQLRGEQTELDKTVLEKISDPLTHLVRNALDHGLEPPDERRAAGKSETGTLILEAYHQGGHITIEVREDGRGIRPDKIRAKAVEKGLISADAVLSEAEIVDLIFAPGFSTAEKVSDLSGRGVGMDVVRSNVQALKGSVDVRTRTGEGSTFSMRLPLTLAILDGQLIQVGDEIFVLPMVSMIESVIIREEDIQWMAGSTAVYALRGQYIPVVRLDEIFAISRSGEFLRQQQEFILVVVESGTETVALQVDALLAQQQVVIKSLETHYRQVPGISGATILGDGRVSLIIDVQEVVGLAGSRSSNRGSRKSLAVASKSLDRGAKHG